jgi:hypothetical protein
MKLRLLVVLAFTLLAVSACVIAPGPYGGPYYGGGPSYGESVYIGGGGSYGGERDRDYGRRVWH